MTEWRVERKDKIVWIRAKCSKCKTGVLIERPLMWFRVTDETGKNVQIDGNTVLRPSWNPHMRLRHSGCNGLVEEPPRTTLQQVLVAAGQEDMAGQLLP